LTRQVWDCRIGELVGGMGANGIVAFWRALEPYALSYGCIKVYNEQNDAARDVRHSAVTLASERNTRRFE